jgi:dihydrofolate reductase
MSLDGYIAGPGGEFDWIPMDPDIDFAGMSEQFDTYLLGRRTFEVTRSHGQATMPGVRTFVFSRTLRQSDYDDVTIVGENWRQVVQSLREEEGKDIWLFGGGSLFRSLAEEGFVDTMEVAIIPIVLGEGIPLVPGLTSRIALTLKEHTVYKKTGTVGLVYTVNNTA